MKKLILLVLLSSVSQLFAQQIDEGNLWRTRGVYDSLGNFIERAKLQSFLYSESSSRFQRLRNQDKVNMETGETKIFVYKDTFNLESIDTNTFKISDEEVMTIHNSDSLTIAFKGYTLPYTRVTVKRNAIDLEKFKSILLNNPFLEYDTEGNTSYEYTYQDNGLKKIKRSSSASEWESEYKLQDFNGFVILQGITSAPKLITSFREKEIKFLELDYRFDIKNGTLKSK